jgi:hypothetical protein
VPSYGGILKAIAHQNAERDAAADPDPRFRKQVIAWKKPGEYEGAWTLFDFNSFFPCWMFRTPPPVGEPRLNRERDDYDYDDDPSKCPVIEAYLRRAKALKDSYPEGSPERARQKTLLNSICWSQKKPKKRVWKDMTAKKVERDAPLLDKTFEGQGRYTIFNGLDMLFNHQEWGRRILRNAKKDLEEHIYRAEKAGFHCIYSRNDSFLVESAARPLFEAELGTDLGQLKIEGETTVGVVIPRTNERPIFLK